MSIAHLDSVLTILCMLLVGRAQSLGISGNVRLC